MKPSVHILRLGFALLLLLSGGSHLRAEIAVRLSVKFILKPDGTRPAGDGLNIDISTPTGFNAEITKGNQVLAATGRGCGLQVTYEDIRPPVPNGTASEYWFNLDARANRATIEAAALADQTTWSWSADSINIYVNNSASGQCSFPGQGSSISLGGTIFTAGTVVHEVGHFFDLRHTHTGDPKCTDGPPFLVGDGDALDVTIEDHRCLLDRDSLSRSNFQGKVFSALTAEEQARVNTSWLNVMSYHQEDQFLSEQMDIWGRHANAGRRFACSGRTWFVAVGGNDDASGADADSPLATVSTALSKVISPDGSRNDVILLRSGNYNSPPGGMINTPCTLSATRGAVSIRRP